MTYWGFSKPQPYVEEEEGCRRPVSRYGHPYDYGAKDGADGTEAWGACLGVLICVMLLLLLAFTASYPVSYYYYPDQKGYRDYSNRACPNCWM